MKNGFAQSTITAILALTISGALGACNSRVDTSSSLPTVQRGGQGNAQNAAGQSGSAGSQASAPGTAHSEGQFNLNDSSANMAQEAAVADGCLKAWRQALSGDEAGAMKMLKELDEKNPGISTVQLMMGQVEEHFGKYKEAVSHYQQAHTINEFSSMQTFKLAESLRKAKRPKEAITYYKKLAERLDRATKDYKRTEMDQLRVAVHMGLANAYKESGQAGDAKDEVNRILETNPNSTEAQGLLKELERTR